MQTFGQFHSLSFHGIQVFTGEWPFPGLWNINVTARLVEGERPTRPEHPAVIEPLWELMQRCWDKKPEDRPTILEVLECLEGIAPIVEGEWKPQPEHPVIAEALLIKDELTPQQEHLVIAEAPSVDLVQRNPDIITTLLGFLRLSRSQKTSEC